MSDLRKEIEKRRTFAIISHPDAGKTTLTEKFLLYGGGAVILCRFRNRGNGNSSLRSFELWRQSFH